MHNQLSETDIFAILAATFVSLDGRIRARRAGETWMAHQRGKTGQKWYVMNILHEDGTESGSEYLSPDLAVSSFIQRFAILGLLRDLHAKALHPLDDVEFFFEDLHPNVAVTWRHLKARFQGLRLILKQDRRVMERIIEEAASM